MKTLLVTLLATAVCLQVSRAADVTGPVTLRVDTVETNEALMTDMVRKHKALEFSRVLVSLNKKYFTALQEQRKFTLTASKDLQRVVDYQSQADSATGLYKQTKASPKAGNLTAAQYTVVLQIDHFLDETQTAKFANGNEGYRRRIQLAGTVAITDNSTGEAYDSVDVKAETNAVRTSDFKINSDGEESDQLLNDIATGFARAGATRTVDVLMPMKVIDREENVVTINRGDRSGLNVGDVLNAFGAGKIITDPDSGKRIRKKGVLLCQVKVTSVDPESAQAEVPTGEKGDKVIVGCVLSKPAQTAQN